MRSALFLPTFFFMTPPLFWAAFVSAWIVYALIGAITLYIGYVISRESTSWLAPIVYWLLALYSLYSLFPLHYIVFPSF